MALLRRYQGKH